MSNQCDNNEIIEKIKYLGIDVENINSVLSNRETKGYKLPKNVEEKVFKQYRYVPLKDIQIFISTESKKESIEKKFKSAMPISEYLPLDGKSLEECTVFTAMLRKVDMKKVDEIEEEQEILNKSIPFKVKYYNNYLWKVYYAESIDKYFMVFTTDELDYSVLFYLIKKQSERKRMARVFVPICTSEYVNNYMKKSDYENLKTYIWTLTNDLPEIYDVFGKDEDLSINVIGETNVYEKIKSKYKIKISSRQDAVKLIKVLKYMYTLQSELPTYYKFIPKIDKDGSIYFCCNGKEMKYEELSNFIKIELNILDFKKEQVYHELKEIQQKIENKKQKVAELDIEYIGKEKQISTYLECKKTLLGKFKYFFKNTKNKKMKKAENVNNTKDEEEILPKAVQTEELEKEEEKKSYTLENLVRICKEYDEKEQKNNELKRENNNLQLRIKNLNKKIQNANVYIDEIEKHKKSIFEFWRYCNKDEQMSLAEGEEENTIIENKKKVVTYDADVKELGRLLDDAQFKLFTQNESNSVYVAGTDLLSILNKIYTGKITDEDLEKSLKKIKENKQCAVINGKNTYDILNLKNEITIEDYSKKISQILRTVQNLMSKIQLPKNTAVYRVCMQDEIDTKVFNLFSVRMEDEIVKILDDNSKNKIYRINFKEGTNLLAYTNTIYSEFSNRTLPIGMDVNSEILVDMSKFRLEEVTVSNFRIITAEKENGKIDTKDFEIIEYDAILK